jgi:hypothetical protein
MALADSYMASVAAVFADRNAGATLEVRLAFQTC